MKHFKLFFALFAMLALGVGNAWAQTVTWEKATSIAAGDVVALVCESKKMELSGISTTSTKYGTGVAYTSAPVGKYELTVEEGKSSGTFSLKNGSNYLYWTSGNSLNKTTTKDAKASWTITFSNGNAIIKNANTPARQLQWNASSPRFACYDNSGQTPVQLYKKVISDEPADVIVKTLESIAVEGMTINYETGDMFKFDGTCTATYSVTKNDVPQEDETKEVTPTSVSTPDMSTAGEKEVTVTYTEDDVTVTATYTINVTENSIYPGTYALALNNTFFGTTAGVAVSAFPTTAKQDDITVTLSGGGTKTRTDADCVRMYQNNTLTFSVPAGYVINSIVFTAGGDWNGSISVNAGTYTNDTKSWAGSAQEVVFSFGAQNRIATATVTYAAADETPEVPTLDAPTFDLEEGTYDEEQEVTLSAEEGTIYYTLDGTTPDAESIEYTAPIVLAECGTTTIKAIAISGENTSSVASATYTIKLPLNNSQANPYTEADAIEVYDGGCYDNQDVYVKGVVANAQFYSSNTYTITLEGGFKFYYFYEAVGEVTFTEDYIVAGDTLVACGKLDNYKGTYQLAAGCYLVDRKAYSAPKVDISNTPETAYTVAEAIALIDNVTSDLTKQVYVKGEISEIDSYNETYGSITYWIKDEEENTFQCYSGLGLNSEQFESVDDLVVGSQVVVYGTLKKHNSTYEFNYNNYIVSLTLPSYTVTVTAENGTVEGLAADGKYEHGAEAELTAIPAEGYEFTCWTSGKDTVS
ncbi:MAG: chitobiase/beta-hexosaminidase C-terminal domain-containing protein, partial [Paludibacteraceae bacterium]|nr:chitobiase/beta-hexosaminidase C-terminal domain-containing protein [Paludibacteraceae bacterium]